MAPKMNPGEPKPKTTDKRSGANPVKAVERLYPFARRSRIVMVGEQSLHACRKKLAFLMVSLDIPPARLESIRKRFAPLPVFNRHSVEEFEIHFGFRNTKVAGFKKSALATSMLRELKQSPN